MSGPAPTFVRVFYDPGKLTLSWIGASITPTTPCQVTLTGGAGPTAYPAAGTSTTISRDLSTGGPWTVQVGIVGGATGPTAPVFTAATTLQRVQNFGTSLQATWTIATGASASSVQLGQTGSGTTDSWTTTDNTITIAKTVTGSAWQIGVRGSITSGMTTCYGPEAVGAVITTSVTLVRVLYSGSDLQMAWTLSGFTRFFASLQQNAATPLTQSVTAGSCTFPGALSGSGWAATVSGQSADRISIGPPTPPVTVILLAPMMARIAYQPPNLLLRWTAVGGQPSYAATIWQGSTSVSQSTSDLETTFAGPFSGNDWNCSVRAQSADAVSFGPPSMTYQPILTAPALLTFAYDGANGAITWTNAAAPAASNNLLDIATGGSAISASVGTSGAASVPMTLSATLSYTATLYAQNGIVLGPPSASLTAITAPPQTPWVGYDGTSLNGFWQPPPGVVPTSYTVALTANGVPVNTFTVTAPTINFAINLAAATAYAMRVRAVAGPVTGPPSPPAFGPYSALQTYTFDGFGRLTAMGWNAQQTMRWTYDAAGNLLTQTCTVT